MICPVTLRRAAANWSELNGKTGVESVGHGERQQQDWKPQEAAYGFACNRRGLAATEANVL